MTGKERIARRIAREFKDGFYVNLGIGLPTMITAYLPEGIDVVFQSENGMLGVGPAPGDDETDPDLINATSACNASSRTYVLSPIFRVSLPSATIVPKPVGV